PQVLSRGKSCASTRVTPSTPARARATAVAAPPGPAPTTNTRHRIDNLAVLLKERVQLSCTRRTDGKHGLQLARTGEICRTPRTRADPAWLTRKTRTRRPRQARAPACLHGDFVAVALLVTLARSAGTRIVGSHLRDLFLGFSRLLHGALHFLRCGGRRLQRLHGLARGRLEL